MPTSWSMQVAACNIIVTTKDQRNNPTYAAVVRAYHSKPVADTIVRVYKGACLPAFKVS